jgi:hypothetical protein
MLLPPTSTKSSVFQFWIHGRDGLMQYHATWVGVFFIVMAKADAD